MQVFSNFQLKKHNTFQLEAKCDFFISLTSNEDIQEFLFSEYKKKYPFYILGDGSNTLFTKDYSGCVVQMNHKGFTQVFEDNHLVKIKVAAGEIWEELIEYCVERNLGGIENLTGIPGRVGSCPIQNIGAYGKEVGECITEVGVIRIDTNERLIISNKDCEFGYRSSVFKNKLKNKVLIEYVVFQFAKQPIFNITYKGIKEELDKLGIVEINIKSIREAIRKIRNDKIPDTKILGTAGSFYKNPCISLQHFNQLAQQYPSIPFYNTSSSEKKIPGAWLIEQCGWKGFRSGDAGVHTDQPLILVNYGKATGQEIIDLSQQIVASVKKTFDIELEPEVNII